MYMIKVGITVWGQEIYIQPDGNDEANLRNRTAVRDVIADGLSGPFRYHEPFRCREVSDVPELEPARPDEGPSRLDEVDGEESVTERLACTLSRYAEGRGHRDLFEAMAAAIAELDARTAHVQR